MKTAWQPAGSWVGVQWGDVMVILWPAREVIGRWVGEVGKRVRWTSGVQAPDARIRFLQGTVGVLC